MTSPYIVIDQSFLATIFCLKEIHQKFKHSILELDSKHTKTRVLYESKCDIEFC